MFLSEGLDLWGEHVWYGMEMWGTQEGWIVELAIWILQMYASLPSSHRFMWQMKRWFTLRTVCNVAYLAMFKFLFVQIWISFQRDFILNVNPIWIWIWIWIMNHLKLGFRGQICIYLYLKLTSALQVSRPTESNAKVATHWTHNFMRVTIPVKILMLIESFVSNGSTNRRLYRGWAWTTQLASNLEHSTLVWAWSINLSHLGFCQKLFKWPLYSIYSLSMAVKSTKAG